MKVNVTERKNGNTDMQAEYDKHIIPSKGGEIVEHQLKVDRGPVSDVLFGNLGYRQFQSLSINGGSYVDFYYTGRDEVGYIFSTRP